MKQQIDLLNFWHDHAGTQLVLCTLVRKAGSSYCAPGAKKIIALGSKQSCGLLSGGCLEGAIEETARQNTHDMPFLESFSTLSETDRLLGYQTGCAGEITILFEKLPPTPADHNLYIPYGIHSAGAGVQIDLKQNLGARTLVETPGTSPDQFFDPWVHPIDLYIVGCGSDAPAFASLAQPLGWQLHFIDYRSDHQPDGLPTRIIPLTDIAGAIKESPHTAIVLVTHNYEADMEIMAGLHQKTFGYIGCLGPAKRYQQMKDDLQKLRGLTIDPMREKIVHAPAGLLPKQRTPETIALSVITEIQQAMNG